MGILDSIKEVMFHYSPCEIKQFYCFQIVVALFL